MKVQISNGKYAAVDKMIDQRALAKFQYTSQSLKGANPELRAKILQLKTRIEKLQEIQKEQNNDDKSNVPQSVLDVQTHLIAKYKEDLDNYETGDDSYRFPNKACVDDIFLQRVEKRASYWQKVQDWWSTPSVNYDDFLSALQAQIEDPKAKAKSQQKGDYSRAEVIDKYAEEFFSTEASVKDVFFSSDCVEEYYYEYVSVLKKNARSF
jgi:hypothetical protein